MTHTFLGLRSRPPLLAGVLSLLLLPLSPTLGLAQSLPADGTTATARLEASPRHGEWINYDAGGGDQVQAWVVYPERNDPAPVVVVIHDIRAMSDWARAVGDQLAADGFIAVVPDLLSGKGPGGGGTDSFTSNEVGRAIRDLDPAEVNRRLRAAAAYGTSLPSATDRVGVVGFCWGGSTSFAFAVDYGDLDAAVVYYGTSPPTETLASVRAPVLGLYGGVDNRVNSTIPAAQAELERLGKRFEVNIYEGAGHGFLGRQSGQDGANQAASESAWPATISFFRELLEQ
ncbi:MAG: dienelactone hydrolase family protein [Gemmatimonadetes bacterium]|nr:dienelactone hydrolase family protein [Gemmatimonadota bacterium]